jgi:hypothetical protein
MRRKPNTRNARSRTSAPESAIIMKRSDAIALLTPSGGGVSEAEAEKTRDMLRDYLQWKDARRRELDVKQVQLALDLMPGPDKSRQH